MALHIIGAGFGRTGTFTLKTALEQLGYAPCYHMIDVIRNPQHAEYWAEIAAGGVPDWNRIFEGHQAAVDFPVSDYWRELAAFYPQAKVILTVRDPEVWFKSGRDTIFGEFNHFLKQDSALGRTMRAIAERNFGGQTIHHDRFIAGFNRHNEAVKTSGLGARLLVYRVSDGWEPLCRFLGAAVPDTPFPVTNTTEDFRKNVSEMPKTGGPEATL